MLLSHYRQVPGLTPALEAFDKAALSEVTVTWLAQAMPHISRGPNASGLFH